jgi:predicted kinase
MELVIFTGLPGSGKSTFYRTHLSRTHSLISKDLMRNVSGRDARQLKLLDAEIRAGRPVVIDNTNVRRLDRAPLITLAKEHRIRVVSCFFVASIPESLLRNSLRAGRARVPDVAIHHFARLLEHPEEQEGFDALIRVRILGEGQFDWRPSPGPSPLLCSKA